MREVLIIKEMGLTHTDFYRDIVRVLGDGGYQSTDNGVTAEVGEKRLQIVLSEETRRKIALISLPVTHVSFTFDGYGDDEIKTFFVLFDRVFRRGGG